MCLFAEDYGISRNFMAISVKAKMHVMILHTTCKFVMVTPTSVTDGQQKSALIPTIGLYFQNTPLGEQLKEAIKKRGNVCFQPVTTRNNE